MFMFLYTDLIDLPNLENPYKSIIIIDVTLAPHVFSCLTAVLQYFPYSANLFISEYLQHPTSSTICLTYSSLRLLFSLPIHCSLHRLSCLNSGLPTCFVFSLQFPISLVSYRTCPFVTFSDHLSLNVLL